MIIDDEVPLVIGMKRYFELRSDFQIVTSTSPLQGWNIMQKQHFDILVIDLRMPEMDGLAFISRIGKKQPDLEIIAISGHANVQDVIQCYKMGVLDFFQKPFELMTLANAIEKSSKFIEAQKTLHKTQEELLFLQKKIQKNEGSSLLGDSPEISHIREMMQKIAGFPETSVVIEGESGVGKELVAHGIHRLSQRKDNHFVAVNCSSVPETLFETEFFGHTKGSFTDATETRPGYVQYAQHGTLFLDEIGEMPLSQQSKLLRLLETKKYHQVGHAEPISCDIRIICASNRPLKKLIEEKKLREDLYYRLNQFAIVVPPLRDRAADIPVLFTFFIEQFSQRYKKSPLKVDPVVCSLLKNYPFPGNVRELKNVAERAVILADGELIRPCHIPQPDIKTTLFPVSGPSTGFNLENIEKTAIEQAIAQAGPSRKEVARLLGITPQSLDRKVEKHRIAWKPKSNPLLNK